jgi:hypothetical protein
MVETLVDVLRNSLMITSFVVVIMLFIELINVLSLGRWTHWLEKKRFLQVVIASLLGSIPGCFGGFAVVGMWTHGLIGFGALLAAMIASVGDEAFVMLVQMPEKAFLLFGILFVIAVAAGFLADRLHLTIPLPKNMGGHLVVHHHETASFRQMLKDGKSNMNNPSFVRVLLIGGLLLFIAGMATGFFGHEHEAAGAPSVGKYLPLDESWFNGAFLILAALMLLTFFFVSDHFLEEHLWKHIIKQHVPKIFLWTFGALLVIHLLMNNVEATGWMAQNPLWVLLFSVLIGFIPESGPHLVFITLFLGGQIPFSVLLANSITQDGHSTLPLLAESKRGFFTVKLLNGSLGYLIGLLGYWIGF